MPRPEPIAWTDVETPETKWIRDCNQCPYHHSGEYDELGYPEKERRCGHPESPGWHLLTNGKGRCPLVHHPQVLRYDWPAYRRGV